jgi:peptidyl-prolyl cis-trans isomerase B (cyclophilin B)
MGNINISIKTSKGKLRLKLFKDKAPYTVANFINLATRGYYDGLTFHRVIEDFMVQAGCPDGNGTGGPGYEFHDEIDAELTHSKPGMLSMANAGPGTNGSQFFITHVETPWLDGKHTVFGELSKKEDQKIIDSIEQGDIIESITILDKKKATYDEMVTACVDVWNDTLDEKFTELKPAS